MAIRIDEKNVDAIALREAEKKLAQLISDRAAKQSDVSTETERMMLRNQSIHHSKLDAEAGELLLGMKTTPVVEQSNIEKLEHEIAVLDLAISRQAQTVDKLRGRFTLQVCEANRARYVEIEKRIAKAVQELAAANEEEVRFIEELRDAGCSSITFRPMRLNVVGIASDSQSLASLHRREVLEYLPEAIS